MLPTDFVDTILLNISLYVFWGILRVVKSYIDYGGKDETVRL